MDNIENIVNQFNIEWVADNIQNRHKMMEFAQIHSHHQFLAKIKWKQSIWN